MLVEPQKRGYIPDNVTERSQPLHHSGNKSEQNVEMTF